MKQVSLSIYDEDYQSFNTSQKLIMNVFTILGVVSITIVFSFLYAWIIDSWLGFIDFSYWEWFKIMIIVNWFGLGRTMETLRIKNGIRSILRRV